MLQVRNVPDELHRKLKARAAKEGLSLSDYVIGELRRLPDRLSTQELLQRVGTIVREDLTPSPADMIRAERDRRSHRERS